MGRKRDKRRRDAELKPVTPPLAALVTPPRPLRPVVLPVSIEDRRVHDPRGLDRPARDVHGRAIRPLRPKAVVVRAAGGKPVKARKSIRNILNTVPHRLQFAQPMKTVVCLRRKMRQEVLHALGKTGRGARRRKPRRNWMSSISC